MAPRAACAATFTVGGCASVAPAPNTLVQCGQPVRAGGTVLLSVSPRDAYSNPTVVGAGSLQAWLAHDVASVRTAPKLRTCSHVACAVAYACDWLNLGCPQDGSQFPQLTPAPVHSGENASFVAAE